MHAAGRLFGLCSRGGVASCDRGRLAAFFQQVPPVPALNSSPDLRRAFPRPAAKTCDSLGNPAKFSDASAMRAPCLLTVLGFSFLAGSVFAQSPVVGDVLKLSRAKVDESVIVTYVQQAPRGTVSAADLLTLHSNGLSSRVLLALLDSQTAAGRAPIVASVEATPPVPAQAPAPPVAQNAETSSAVVEVPVVNYVAAPVYVGPGSVYYYDEGWWGFGWGLGVGWGWGCASWGWNSCSPWYAYGWYPYYGYYYGDCDSDNHHGDDYHHGNGGHQGNSGQDGKGQVHSLNRGGREAAVGRSTVAASAGSQNREIATSRVGRPATGAAPASQPMTASRGGGTASSTPSSRSAVSTLPGTRGVESRSGSTVQRSSTYVPAGRASTVGVAPNTGASPGVASSASRPATLPGSRQAPTTVERSTAVPAGTAPSSYGSAGTTPPRYVGSPATSSGYQVGQRAPASSVGAGGGYAPSRSYSAPAASYSAGRSSRGSSGGGGGRR